MSQNQKLFIGNLNFNTEEEVLREHFEKECGSTLSEVRIIKSPVGKSLGYAFITFESSEAAQKGLKLDGSELDGRNIRVSEAQERRRDGGGAGGRGGWAGGNRAGDRGRSSGGWGGSRDRMGGGDRGGRSSGGRGGWGDE